MGRGCVGAAALGGDCGAAEVRCLSNIRVLLPPMHGWCIILLLGAAARGGRAVHPPAHAPRPHTLLS